MFSNIKKIFLIASLGIFFVSFQANAETWVSAKGDSCDLVCKAKGQHAVSTPNAFQNGENFMVCRTKIEGQRPGYNLQPNWSHACYVGHGGQEKGFKTYSCLCNE